MSRCRVLQCVAVLLGVAAAGAEEKQESVSIGAAADLFCKYVWRGQNVIDDWVLQPSASFGYKGFTGSIWANVDLTGELVDGWEISEVDYTLEYAGNFPGQKIIGYSLGVIHYDFPNTVWEATSEVYGGLTAAVPLSPTIRAYYDFDEIEGAYVQFSIGHTIEKIVKWGQDYYCNVQATASLGYGNANYNDGYFGVDDGALNDLTLTAGLPVYLGKWMIRPSVAYSTMMDDDVRAATAKSDNFWAGIGAAYQF
ncbi:MAG: hypothetical protein JW955_08165 [Sedimentisphaerales bacterium]|nr:hypothetical protein [Sedimentisphaerales bacterium]